MKTHVNKVEQKQGKSGKIYWVVDTPQGRFSTFNKKVADDVAAYVGGEADLILKQNGDFTNVEGVNTEGTLSSTPTTYEEVKEADNKPKGMTQAVASKETREYVEFACEIAGGIYINSKGSLKLEDAMEQALEVVARARKFFEGWSE